MNGFGSRYRKLRIYLSIGFGLVTLLWFSFPSAFVYERFALLNTNARPTSQIKTVVLFGDSYTDQSRQHSIDNGNYPGKHYKQLYPPLHYAADGGYQWPWYLGLYGNFSIWNYAVGGAPCSNKLTPLHNGPNGINYPDVSAAQQAWFIEDHMSNYGTPLQRLHLDPSEFVVVIFVGTNDLGGNSFITDFQSDNISLVDLAECQLGSIRSLYNLGVGKFILNTLTPLQLTRNWSNVSEPVVHHKRMFNLVNSLNRILRDGVRELGRELVGVDVQYFDTYAFFEEMYYHPWRYFNGSIPPIVEGYCGGCPEAERDSYMYWDVVHPSEQAGRNLAAELLKKIKGKSVY